MRPSIVWASVLMVAYEVLALKTGRWEPWTDSAAKRHKRAAIIWGYWIWLGVHLLTGGKV